MPRKDNEKNKEYQREWYKKNKQEQIRRNKIIQAKKALFIREYKQNNPCIKCGEKDIRCLQFHHINPNTKILEICKLVKNNVSLEKIINEVSKCVILCANCHFKEHDCKTNIYKLEIYKIYEIYSTSEDGRNIHVNVVAKNKDEAKSLISLKEYTTIKEIGLSYFDKASILITDNKT